MGIKATHELVLSGITYRVVEYDRPKQLASVLGTINVFAYRKHKGQWWKWVKVPKGWAAYKLAIAVAQGAAK
jgi:hypothetical protein